MVFWIFFTGLHASFFRSKFPNAYFEKGINLGRFYFTIFGSILHIIKHTCEKVDIFLPK